jgi:hypothetical protein
MVEQQLAQVRAENDTLRKQNGELQAAIESAASTGDHIEKAQAQGAEAKAAAVDRPIAVAKLDEQHRTLTDAASANKSTQDQLTAALDDNATLKASNASLQQKLAATRAAADAKDAENSSLRADNAKKDQTIAQLKTLHLQLYWGLSIAAVILGITGIIWIPAPAKTLAYVVATAGAVGIGFCIFVVTWMAVMKWVLLVGVVGFAGYLAWSHFRTRGALLKTSEGVQGIKQDLTDLATAHPGTTVGAAADQMLTDYFGTKDKSGIFHWLHSEYQTIVDDVRRRIGRPAAAK